MTTSTFKNLWKFEMVRCEPKSNLAVQTVIINQDVAQHHVLNRRDTTNFQWYTLYYLICKGVLLCFFHFLYFSQCVVCMFGHKKIYKVTNLKVHSKGRYFLFLNPFSRTTTNSLNYKVVFLYLWYHKNKSRQRKFEWLGGGENAWLSTARFKIETRCGCFYITVFLKETDCLQKIMDVI